MSKYLKIIYWIWGISIFSCNAPDELPSNQKYFLKYYGNGGDQYAVGMVMNPDGTMILLGNSHETPSASQQLYVVKIDLLGNIIWEKTYGDTHRYEAKDIKLLPDGNLLLLANKQIAINDRDVCILKISPQGELVKEVTQGLKKKNGEPSDEDASKIAVTSIGYIVAGSTTAVADNTVVSDISDAMTLLFKSDLTWVSDETGEWRSTIAFSRYSFVGEDRAIEIFERGPNTFYVMGYSNTNFNLLDVNKISKYHYFYLTLSADAKPSEIESIDSKPDDQKLVDCSQIPTQLGAGYILTGTSSVGDIYFVHLSRNLNQTPNDIVLERNLNIKNSGNYKLQHTKNWPSTTSEVFIVSEKVVDGNSDIFLCKVNRYGEKIFEQTFGGNGDDMSASVIETPDRHILLLGTMTLGGVVDGQKKMVLMKLNSQGRIAP